MKPAVTDPLWVRILLTGLALLFLFGFLVIPLAAVFSQAFEQGWRAYLAALYEGVPNLPGPARLARGLERRAFDRSRDGSRRTAVSG